MAQRGEGGQQAGHHPGLPPGDRTTFVGRRRELGELAELLSRHRLVTITGVGGAGKSRLALRAAAAAAAPRDGVHYAALAGVGQEGRLVSVLAEATGMPRGGEVSPRGLTAWLAPRDVLVVVDDCEHLATACAQLVDGLLGGAPGLRVLATSREPLGVDGEVVWALTPLEVPRPGLHPTVDEALRWDAVRLLVDRAGAVHRGFTLDEHVVDAVLAICRRLDGLPLALELAAARLSHLTPQEVAARLDDRFGLLTSRSRGGLPRHRTLEATLDWSHDLLGTRERAVLRRLSTFVGSFTLAGAEAVCADGDEVHRDDVLDALAALCERSLLTAGPRDGATHYRFLESVREYGGDRLREHAETESARHRHARWHLDWLDGRVDAPGSPAWVAAASDAYEDAAAAVAWAADTGEADLALGIAAALWQVCEVEGRLADGRALLEAALAVPGWRDPGTRGHALEGAGNTALLQGDLATAEARYLDRRELCRQRGDDVGAAGALRSLGIVALMRGEVATARRECTRALERLRTLGDERGCAYSLTSLGLVERAAGDDAAAQEAFAAALGMLDGLGMARDAADVLCNLGDLHCDGGALQEAARCYREADRRYHSIGDLRGAALAMNNLAIAAHDLGDDALALQSCTDAAARFQQLGDRPGVAAAKNNLANLAAEGGDLRRARSGYLESIAIYEELGDESGATLVRRHLAELDQATPQPDGGLTPREREVVGLVADGLTNREIAQRLHLSGRTVESHVSSARRKLSVTSRTQLVRWALETPGEVSGPAARSPA